MQGFWTQDLLEGYPMLHGRRNADVVVIGAGFSGLHTALWLAKAGLRVIVLEAETIGCGASSRCAGLATVTNSQRFARVERQMGAEAAAAYARTEQSALRALRELSKEKGMRSRWQDTDAFLVASSEQEIANLDVEAHAMQRAGIAASLTQATQCPLPTRKAICLRDQAMLDPYLHLVSVVQKAESLGVQFFEHSRVTALESNLAYTLRGSVLAPYLVVATGFPILNIPGWYFLRLMQRQCELIPLESAEPFEGAYLDCNGNFSIRNVRDGALMSMFDGRVGTRPRETARERFARQYATRLGASVPEQFYTGYETYSADGLPFIGAYGRKTPNLFVACGYGGCGLVGSVMAAQIISAKVLGLPVSDYELYSGRRFTGGILLDDLRCTSIQLGQYVAGMFRWKAPRCPHMGCKLVYRRESQCWECPCHGSRFDAIGRVINAPAVRDAVIRHRRDGH